MNKSNLKRYAPQARRDFIAAVTGRAHLLGLSAIGDSLQVEPCAVSGDIVLIGGRAWPLRVQGQREQLIARMRRDGFAHTLEAVAYTWFNRLAALRYMELHDYLGHGRRVLSNLEGGLPEVLTHALELAEDGALPGLNTETVRQLKLDNKDGELYRRVLVAQCNALNRAMPWLFEAIDDETELLLPESLLLSDSIVTRLVNEIPEEDWAEVEVIGWLYQFYISEKKDQVIGKVVKSEDIPAATQLFTPNWIVQYLVQNSVGRLWLMAHPGSTLASQWPYYIEPVQQTPAVQAQLDTLIQARIHEDGDSLNPESITVLDPACGSGHILVEAYEVLKAIYLERGYRLRDVPRLILEKNLFGLDIDDRAAQMAAFALLMKARKDDRRLLSDPDNPPRLTVLSLQESKGLSLDELASHLAPFGAERGALKELLDAFEHAKTFGSLIRIAPALRAQLPAIGRAVQQAKDEGDLYAKHAAHDLEPLLGQALVLAMRFDAVVANPPYMGGKGMNTDLKEYAQATFPEAKADLFAMFIEQGAHMGKNFSFNSMVTMQSWMFLSSYEDLRSSLINNRTITNFIHIGYNSFPELNSKVAQACAFCILSKRVANYNSIFYNLNEAPQSADKNEVFLNLDENFKFLVSHSNFESLPGMPLAYWANREVTAAFANNPSISSIAKPRVGMTTGDNARFLRHWSEIDFVKASINGGTADPKTCKWFPANKGGEFRRWFGNAEFLVNWENSGKELLQSEGCFPRSRELFFKECITWSAVTSSSLGARYSPPGFIPITGGSSLYVEQRSVLFLILCFLASKVASYLAKIVSQTLNIEAGSIGALPIIINDESLNFCQNVFEKLVSISQSDWDSLEVSWGFLGSPMATSDKDQNIAASWERWKRTTEARIKEAAELERQNNIWFIETYSLQNHINPSPEIAELTLIRANRETDSRHFVSYVLGCTLGRYSLDTPGLIYAHAGNIGFDPEKYKTFPAEGDGILPITEDRWFEEDAGSRVVEFVRTVWGEETLQENLAWLAESLGRKASEVPEDAIRRYLADKFFKDHLQTYRKRPIYWLFSSGKQGAFQALVYLHRYHEGTLARLRSEYVLPLTGKMHARIEALGIDIRKASSTVQRTGLTRKLERLKKQHQELLAYDEELRHYADQRIALDLDDGVKTNYGKFGDLLAEVKAVTGGKEEE